MGPGDVKITKDYTSMFLGEVDVHNYWGAWDIDSDGKPDILRVEDEDEPGISTYCFPAQTGPTLDSSKYEATFQKFPDIAEACDHEINTLTACSSKHLAAVNDKFGKARKQALGILDSFQDAVLNGKILKEMVDHHGDRMNWNSIETRFLGPDGQRMEVKIDEVDHGKPAWPFSRRTCSPDNTWGVTSMHLEGEGTDVYIDDMRLLNRDVKEWVNDYYHMSWVSVAWMFNDDCPGLIFEWFSDVDYSKSDLRRFYTKTEPRLDWDVIEYCNTHSDEVCEPEYEAYAAEASVA